MPLLLPYQIAIVDSGSTIRHAHKATSDGELSTVLAASRAGTGRDKGKIAEGGHLVMMTAAETKSLIYCYSKDLKTCNQPLTILQRTK
jgi:hypothetical protein